MWCMGYFYFFFYSLWLYVFYVLHSLRNKTIIIIRRRRRRSSTIAERPARRSVLVEMLFYCCTNNAHKLLVSLRSTLTNWHVLFRYLHIVAHVSFNYRTANTGCRGVINRLLYQCIQPYNQLCWCHLDHNCDHQISTSTELNVDVTACSSASAPSWTRTTVADGHIFDGKASETLTSGSVV